MAGGNERGRPIFAAVFTALGRLDADVLFTIGPFDPDWLGPVPTNISVAAYVPQAKAMICDIVVSHGGSGTTIAALTRGLPTVAVPMFADQTHNADRLVAAGSACASTPDKSNNT
jgi:UDP:flavonoid glycosyltransferase YjiC (YdhE family)